MNEQTEFVIKVIHSHESVPEKCMFKRTIKKEQVVTSVENALEIIKNNFKHCQQLRYLLNDFHRIFKGYNQTNKKFKTRFVTVYVVNMPEVLQVDTKNRFLRFDSGMQDNDRFIVFFQISKKYD
ncbi:uncharacterized protein VNE69_11110 [Vairimorpha necatrix]|uniref:Uncharacterized protein n=1 Tax=Vairimorpha necatrix TaxID=6039 RepID=A0AAX4JG51_9MICR